MWVRHFSAYDQPMYYLLSYHHKFTHSVASPWVEPFSLAPPISLSVDSSLYFPSSNDSYLPGNEHFLFSNFLISYLSHDTSIWIRKETRLCFHLDSECRTGTRMYFSRVLLNPTQTRRSNKCHSNITRWRVRLSDTKNPSTRWPAKRFDHVRRSVSTGTMKCWSNRTDERVCVDVTMQMCVSAETMACTSENTKEQCRLQYILGIALEVVRVHQIGNEFPTQQQAATTEKRNAKKWKKTNTHKMNCSVHCNTVHDRHSTVKFYRRKGLWYVFMSLNFTIQIDLHGLW